VLHSSFYPFGIDFFFFTKGSLFVKSQGGPWGGRTGRLASQGSGAFGQMRLSGGRGRPPSPLCHLGLPQGQVALAQRWGKLRGPQLPVILEQAPPWSALDGHQCHLQVCPRGLPLDPAVGVEPPQ
jgi:hypothetical protein